METKPAILIVDDEFSIRESFNLILSSAYRVIQAASGEGALKMIADQAVDLAYLDIRMPGLNGIETLKRIKEIAPQTEVIMVTAVNDVQKASEAINLGAYDYVVKPFDVEKILGMTRDILRKKGMRMLTRGITEKEILPPGGAAEFSEALAVKINEAAKSTDPVLIAGEAGTEKEWVAAQICGKSSASPEFNSLDAKGKSLNFLESKLFSESKGETTADLKKAAGLMAEPGVLFIDNIECLPEALLNKLAGAKARLVFGTTLADNELRGALFKHALKIEIMPLRSRPGDIPQIIAHLTEKEFSPEALNLLSSYGWPGNMLELASVVEQLALTAGQTAIGKNDLPLAVLLSSSGGKTMPFEEVFTDFEKEFIADLLKANLNDKEKTARMLKISQNVLETKL